MRYSSFRPEHPKGEMFTYTDTLGRDAYSRKELTKRLEGLLLGVGG
jgi:hypothetical protein